MSASLQSFRISFCLARQHRKRSILGLFFEASNHHSFEWFDCHGKVGAGMMAFAHVLDCRLPKICFPTLRIRRARFEQAIGAWSSGVE